MLVVLLLAVPAQATAKPRVLTIKDVRVTEGARAVFTVTLSKQARRAVKVRFATGNATASAPADFAARTGTLTIRKRKRRGTIAVRTVDDGAIEAGERFTLKLSKPRGAKLKRRKATATIVDNDAAPAGPAADLALSGSHVPATYRGGTPLVSTLTVTNNGPDAADRVVVSDSLPAGAATSELSPGCLAAAAGTVTCELGTLAPGTSTAVTVGLVLPVAGAAQAVSNVATATASTADPSSANNGFTDALTIPAGNETLATTSASLPADGTQERRSETLLGDLVADSFRAAAGSTFAVVTGSDLKAGLSCDVSPATAFCPMTSGPPFAITRGSVLATLPAAHRLVKLTISGAELRQMLAHAVATNAASDAFLQVAGFCFGYDTTVHTVGTIRLLDQPFCTGTDVPNDATQYTIAMTAETAAGANGFADLSSRATPVGFDADALTDYLLGHTSYTAEPQFRISGTT